MSRIRIEDGDVFGLVLTDLREQRRRLELVAESHRKDEFMAMLAHELRNPLAPIRNALALLGMPGISASSLDMSRQIIDRQVNQLVRILDDLLDVQRFTHGVIVLKTEPTDLGLPIESALDAIRSTAAAKSQRIEVERPAEPAAGPGGRGADDADRLEPARQRREVQPAAELDPDLLGPGRPPRAHPDRGRGHRHGAGAPAAHLRAVRAGRPRPLALPGGSRCRSHAREAPHRAARGDRDGGERRPGEGLGVRRHLPLLAQAAGLLGPAPRPPAPRRAAAARRVLVVDDNEDSAVSLCALLNLSGHQASLAHDGVEALRLAPALAPQVVILDLGLPGMDGYEVARRLREIAALEGCRLVALTGYGSSQDRSRTRAAGFAAHLVKPVELDALLDVIAAPLSAGRVAPDDHRAAGEPQGPRHRSGEVPGEALCPRGRGQASFVSPASSPGPPSLPRRSLTR
jgi:CheY-like chemotaxis protein